MRTEKEIIDNVIQVATADNSVRAVIRTELFIVKEYLHSYQFCFIVEDIEKYSGICDFGISST